MRPSNNGLRCPGERTTESSGFPYQLLGAEVQNKRFSLNESAEDAVSSNSYAHKPVGTWPCLRRYDTLHVDQEEKVDSACRSDNTTTRNEWIVIVGGLDKQRALFLTNASRAAKQKFPST